MELNLLTVQANASIKVPLIDVWVNNDAMPAGLIKLLRRNSQLRSARLSFGTKEQALSEIALRRDGNAW